MGWATVYHHESLLDFARDGKVIRLLRSEMNSCVGPKSTSDLQQEQLYPTGFEDT
jgi:hypothetical protein